MTRILPKQPATERMQRFAKKYPEVVAFYWNKETHEVKRNDSPKKGRIYYWQSCGRKARFSTEESAMRQLESLDNFALTYYKCIFGDHYHVANKVPPIAKSFIYDNWDEALYNELGSRAYFCLMAENGPKRNSSYWKKMKKSYLRKVGQNL